MSGSDAYLTDEYGNVIFAESGDGDRCPVCRHTADQHKDDGCTEHEGYDHLNGSHECGCPLMPARGEESS